MNAISLFNCQIKKAEISNINIIMSSGHLINGVEVNILEEKFEELFDRPSVLVSDITHALQLALITANVKAGDEVLILSYNCLSSTSAISGIGAIPIWIDLSDTMQMSLSDCYAALTSKTKAVIVYHVAGYPAPIDEYVTFCKAHNLILIEDVNNALGATFHGKLLGTFGAYSAFSFYANRQINGVQGGLLVCPSIEIKQEIRRLRYFGIDSFKFRDSNGEINPVLDIPKIGFSAGMSNLNASLALMHWTSLNERIETTRFNVEHLVSRLSTLSSITCVEWAEHTSPVFWVFFIRCSCRDALLLWLKKFNIQCGKLHHPNHHYTGFNSPNRALPKTNIIMSDVLALPCGWWLTKSEIDFIADTISDFFEFEVRINE